MTDDQITTCSPRAPRLTPASLAEVYSLGAHRAIIDAAEGHAAAPLLYALAHVGGLAHAAAGYPRHLLSPLRDVLAAVDRLPDAAALAAWALGELPAGDLEPRPDGERAALRARAEAAEQRAEAAEAEVERLRVLGPDTEARVTIEARLLATEVLRPTVDAWRAEVARVAAERDDAAAAAGAAAVIARTAQAEVARLRAAIAETLRLSDIYAGVAAHNAKAEPETAGEAWRSPYMATMRELRRALGGAA